MARSDAITLPGPLQPWIEGLASAFLENEATPAFDFARPRGEPALIAPDSVTWAVFKNPLVLFVGGVAAVLLELAEPRIRDPLWERTSFRRDPLVRLQRTGLAALATVYGPRRAAEAMIAGVNRIHAGISGVTSEGLPYRADDPDLLVWVQATAAYGIFAAYDRHIAPLGRAGWDRGLSEGQPVAALYGAAGAPATLGDMEALFARARPSLRPTPIAFEFLDLLRRVPLLPAAARPFQPLLLRAAVDLLPSWVRDRLGLARRSLAPWQRPLVTAAMRAADRIILRSAPAVQSCRRLGLPDDYLYPRATTSPSTSIVSG